MPPNPIPNFTVRHRAPLIDRVALYGEFASVMIPRTKLHDDMINRAAYVFITGCYPSHLRPRSAAILKQITHHFRRPSSLDGRNGDRLLHDDAIRDLRLRSHEMVNAVQERVSQRFYIQTDRGPDTRRGYSKIFMFRRHTDQMVIDKITINLEGAVKPGWD